MHKETLARRRLYTQMFLRKKLPVFCTKMPLRNNKSTQALLHTEPLLRKVTFAQNNFCTKKNTQKKIDTEKRVHTDCTKKIHTETFTYKNFTQNNFYTETFPHRNLCALQFLHGRFHTQMPLHKKSLTHKNLCTQHAFTHNQLLHREALLPLLDRLMRFPPPK